MRRLGLLATAFLLTSAASAAAQDDSRAEVSVGWRYYHATIQSLTDPIELPVPNDFSKSWYADVAVNVSEKFAIVGDASGTYYSDEMTRTLGSFTTRETLDVTFHTFMGGVRVRAPQVAWIVPFGQVLFGGERDSSSRLRELTFTIGAPSVSEQEASSTNAVLGLDGGMTIAAGFLGVRTQVGYARFFSRADADAFRFSLGAVVRF